MSGPRIPSPAAWVPALGVFALSVAVYLGTLWGGFVWDDTVLILENPYIRDLRHIRELIFSDIWAFTGDPDLTRYYRPLLMLLYTFDYHVFGPEAWGYHLVNVVINALATVCVYYIFFTIAGRGEGTAAPERPETFAFAAAALYSVHPARTEAVAWAGGEPLFGLFFFLAFLLYIRGRLYLSLLVFFLSLFVKETSVALIGLLVAHDMAFGHPYPRKKWSDILACYLHYPVVVAAYVALRTAALGGVASFVPRHAYLTPFQKLLNSLDIFANYLGTFALPINLNAFHVFDPVLSPGEPRAVAAVAAAAAVCAGFLYGWRNNRFAFFLGALALLPLAPALYMPALGENTFAERYLYAPSAGLAGLVALALMAANSRASVRGRKAIALMAAALIVSLAALTVARNPVWRDDLSLWSDTVRKSPGHYIVQSEMGYSLMSAGMYDEAARYYEAALALRPDHLRSHVNLATAYLETGRYDDAIRHYQLAIAIKPDAPSLYETLADAYGRRGWDARAAEYRRKAGELREATERTGP